MRRGEQKWQGHGDLTADLRQLPLVNPAGRTSQKPLSSETFSQIHSQGLPAAPAPLPQSVPIAQQAVLLPALSIPSPTAGVPTLPSLPMPTLPAPCCAPAAPAGTRSLCDVPPGLLGTPWAVPAPSRAPLEKRRAPGPGCCTARLPQGVRPGLRGIHPGLQAVRFGER